MAASVVYSAIFGAVLATLPPVTTSLVVFDTSVVELTDELADPIDLLFSVRLGFARIRGAAEIAEMHDTRPHSVLRSGGEVLPMISSIARVSVLAVPLLCACTGESAESISTKWVTPNGSESSNCTESEPCSLLHALAIAEAGDTVKVAAGVYAAPCTGDRSLPAFQPANSGKSATQPITFIGAGDSTTELRCASGEGPVFGARSRQWIVWDGFMVDESRSPSVADTGPVVVWASDGVTLRNLLIRGATIPREDNHTGIRLEQTRDITIENNTITGIRHSRSPSQNFAAIMGYDAIRVSVTNNTISDCDVGIFPKGDHAMPEYGLGGWRITGNRIEALRSGLQIGGLKTGSDYGRSEISENLLTGDGGLGGLILVSYDGVSPRAIDIVRNTVTGFDAAIIATKPEGAQAQVDITIRDNVLAGKEAAINIFWMDKRDSFSSDHNLLWPSAGSRGGWYADGNTRDSLGQWRAATGNDVHSISTNPRLSKDFELPSKHVGHTAGSNGGAVGASISSGRFGARPSGPDPR